MKISIIAAAAENNVIGNKGAIPWHLPTAFKHFKELTMGHPIIMGSKTFASIGKPLPGRTNIVLATDPIFAAEGCLVAHSLDEALRLAGGADEAFICGGGRVYAAALPLAQTIHLTRVHANVPGDVFFPELDQKEWRLVREEHHARDEKNPFDFTFLTYERRVEAQQQ